MSCRPVCRPRSTPDPNAQMHDLSPRLIARELALPALPLALLAIAAPVAGAASKLQGATPSGPKPGDEVPIEKVVQALADQEGLSPALKTLLELQLQLGGLTSPFKPTSDVHILVETHDPTQTNPATTFVVPGIGGGADTTSFTVSTGGIYDAAKGTWDAASGDWNLPALCDVLDVIMWHELCHASPQIGGVNAPAAEPLPPNAPPGTTQSESCEHLGLAGATGEKACEKATELCAKGSAASQEDKDRHKALCQIINSLQKKYNTDANNEKAKECVDDEDWPPAGTPPKLHLDPGLGTGGPPAGEPPPQIVPDCDSCPCPGFEPPPPSED
jgi:hypothetical protein